MATDQDRTTYTTSSFVTSKCIPPCSSRDLAVHQLNAVHECKETITARNYLVPTATYNLVNAAITNTTTQALAGGIVHYLAEGDALVTLRSSATATGTNMIVLPTAVPGRTIKFIVPTLMLAAQAFMIAASVNGPGSGVITANFAPTPSLPPILLTKRFIGGSGILTTVPNNGVLVGAATPAGTIITFTGVASGQGTATGTATPALPLWVADSITAGSAATVVDAL